MREIFNFLQVSNDWTLEYSSSEERKDESESTLSLLYVAMSINHIITQALTLSIVNQVVLFITVVFIISCLICVLFV